MTSRQYERYGWSHDKQSHGGRGRTTERNGQFRERSPTRGVAELIPGAVFVDEASDAICWTFAVRSLYWAGVRVGYRIHFHVRYDGCLIVETDTSDTYTWEKTAENRPVACQRGAQTWPRHAGTTSRRWGEGESFWRAHSMIVPRLYTPSGITTSPQGNTTPAIWLTGVSTCCIFRRGMKWHMRGLGEDGGLGLDVCQVKCLAPHHRAVTQLVLRLAVRQGTAE